MKFYYPEDEFILKWNRSFLLCSVIALSLDPLFLYIPIIKGTQKCLGMDRDLEIVVCILRSLADILYAFHIIIQFRTAHVGRHDGIFGRTILKGEPQYVAKHYLKSYFIIDVLAALPLPQKYLHSYSNQTLRMEEMTEKRREAEDLMSYMFLPGELRQRVRRHKQYKWKTTRGVDLDSFVKDLPRDLRSEKRHLCLRLLKRVPAFGEMDVHLLDALCDRLKAVLYTKDSYLFREGDPAHEMIFITCGKLKGIKTSYVSNLRPGDFCGDELLTWAMDPRRKRLPFSTTTVKALVDVQAFSLAADDLLFIVSQFRLFDSRKFQHIVRYYSHLWRTWATCFIQVAWRKHLKSKGGEILGVANERVLQDGLATGNDQASTLSLGASIYVSRLSSSALHILRRNHDAQVSTQPLMPKSLTLDDGPYIEIKIE